VVVVGAYAQRVEAAEERELPEALAEGGAGAPPAAA
jgi:hypothetical protein